MRVNNKSNRFTENDFQPYHINRCWWKVCSDSDAFKPSDATLIDIDIVFETYDNPINPMSKPKLQTRSCGAYRISTRTCQRRSPQGSEEHSRVEIESNESQPAKYYAKQPTCSPGRGPSIEFVSLNNNYFLHLKTSSGKRLEKILPTNNKYINT